MNAVNADAVILALLAASDLAFLAWLRRRRTRRLREEHMYYVLRLHLHRENTASRSGFAS